MREAIQALLRNNSTQYDGNFSILSSIAFDRLTIVKDQRRTTESLHETSVSNVKLAFTHRSTRHKGISKKGRPLSMTLPKFTSSKNTRQSMLHLRENLELADNE